MPLVKITNKTPRPINVALTILVPIHFHNELMPQQSWETQVGSVGFKFECREDDGSNRYSISQSATTLGLFSLTGASIALVALPLAITGLAPIAGSSCTLLTALAGKPLIVAAATPEILTLTTWIATNLTRKTVYQIASEKGLKEEELEQTLQETTTLLDGIKYLCLPTTSPDATKEAPRKPTDSGGTPVEIQAGETWKSSLLLGNIMSPEMLDKFLKFYSAKNDRTLAVPQTKKLEPIAAPPFPSDPKTAALKVRKSSLDSLTSVLQELTKFHSQNKKHKRRKGKKKGLDSDAREGTFCNTMEESGDEEQRVDEWEMVEGETGLKATDHHPCFNANQTIYIGFNSFYQFEWKINPDFGNQGPKFMLVDTSDNLK